MDFYSKPKKEGMYIINYGDCVVYENMEQVLLYNNKNNELEFVDKNGEKIKVNEMSENSWKWFPASEIFKQIDDGELKVKKNKGLKNKP